MKLAWVTDIHLNFIGIEARTVFYKEISGLKCDGLLITGDIAEAPCLIDILTEIAAEIKIPIYFVLGNHDYYKGTISEVRDSITSLTRAHHHLFWMPASGIKILTNETILIGQDGWADGRMGDYQNSAVELNDSYLIAELASERIRGKTHLLEKMHQLADNDAAQLRIDLDLAIRHSPRTIIVLTHVPPFKEACMYRGKMTDDNWLPYFSSKVMGDVLLNVAQSNPLIKFLVLSGHTHSMATCQPLTNLTVRSGHAQYGKPVVQDLLEIGVRYNLKYTLSTPENNNHNIDDDSVNCKRTPT